MKPISDDVRKLIVEARRDEKLTFLELSERFKVSLSAAHMIVTRFEKTGCYKAHRYPGKEPRLQQEYGDRLKGWIEEEPDITLGELADRLAEAGKSVHPSTIKRVLDKLGFTYKKKRRWLRKESEKIYANDAKTG